MTTTRRVLRRGMAASAAAALLVALALSLFASSASASPQGITVNVQVNLGPPLSDAEQLISGVTGNLLSVVTGSVCQRASILLGGGPLSPAATLACELQLVNLDLHTIYRNPAGTMVTRDQTLVPEVPTLVDLTGDGVPDVLALVTLSSVNAVTLNVTTLPTAPSVMPAQTELIIRDPSNPSSNQRISAGFNALSSTVPQTFHATASLLGIAPLQLGLTVNVTKPGADLALIGSLFGLSPNGTRQVAALASLDYAPVPASLGYRVLLAQQHEHVTATASAPSVVTASVGLTNGNDTQAILGTVNQIPSTVDVDVINEGPAQRQASYAGSSAIGAIDMSYQDLTQTGGSTQLNTQIVGHIRSLPTSVTFQQSGPRVFSFATSGGAIGLVEGGFATGEQVIPVPGTGSGAYIKAGGGLLSGAVRISGLSAANVDMSKPYLADVTSVAQPLQITYVDNDLGQTFAGTVNDLPAHLTLKVDPQNGEIIEDGHGQGIAKITATATSATPFSDRIARLGATLTGIPASFDLKYTHAPGTFSAAIDHPIGEIQLDADDGTNTTSVGTDSGVSVIDTPSKYAVAATVYGLQSLSFTAKPLDIALTSAAGHVWNATADIQDPATDPEVKATGVIDQLPPTLELKLVPDPSGSSTQVLLTEPNGSPAITHIGVDVSQPGQPFVETATHAHADLYNVLGGFNANIDDTNHAVSLALDNPIGEVDIALDDGVHTTTVPGTDAGLGLIDSGGTFAAAARVFGLQAVTYQKSPLSVSYQGAAGHVFKVDAKVDVTTTKGVITTTGTGVVEPMPATAAIELVPGSTSGNGDVYFTEGPGAAAINHLGLDAMVTPALLENANHVKVDLHTVPSSFDLSYANGDGAFSALLLDPAGGPAPAIGEVDASLDDGTHTATVPGTDAGVGLIDSGGTFAVAARVFGLQKIYYQKSPLDASFQAAPGHVFSFTATVDVDSFGPTTATGLIDQMPAAAEIKLQPGADPSSGDLIYTGDAVHHLTLDAHVDKPLVENANHAAVDLTTVPGSFDLKYTSQDGSFSGTLLAPGGGPAPAIGTVVASLDDGVHAVTLPASSLPGSAALSLLDSAGTFAVAARVYGLSSISFTAPTTISVHSAGAPRFDVSATIGVINGLVGVHTQPVITTFVGDLEAMPSDVDLQVINSSLLGTGYTLVNYDGHGQTIIHAAVDAMSTQPLFTTDSVGTGPTHAHAEMLGLPASFHMFLISPADGGIQAGMDNPVFLTQANLDDNTTPTGIGTMFPIADDAISVTDTTANEVTDNGPGFAVDAQIYGLSSVSVATKPLINVSVQAAAGHELTLQGRLGDYPDVKQSPTSRGPLQISADVDQLPSSFSMTQTQTAAQSTFHYHASSPIDKATVTMETPDEGSTQGPIIPGFGNFVYGEIDGLPAFPDGGPAMDLTVPKSGGGDGPILTIDTHSHPVNHVVFEVLESNFLPSETTLVQFPDPKSMVNGFKNNNASPSLDNDGVIYQCCENVDNTILAISIHGLISASIQTKPYLSTSLDVDPTFSKTVGLGIVTPGPFSANGAILNGFIDKPAPNTSFSISQDTNKNPVIDYSAGAPVKEIDLHTLNAGPEQQLDLQNLPTRMHGCVGTGFAVDTCVLEDGPTPIPEDISNPTGEHNFAVYFTDDGTSLNPATCEQDAQGACLPITVNDYIPLSCQQPGGCEEPSFNTLPPSSFDPSARPNGEFVKVNNLQFHTLLVDAFFTACNGAELCGKFSIDTHGQELTGNAYYSNPTLAGGTWAGMGLGPGFRADYREIWFNNLPVTNTILPTSDDVGYADCPSPTFIGGVAQVIGTNVLNMTPAVCA